MCDNFAKYIEQNFNCDKDVQQNNGEYTVKGKLNNNYTGKIIFWAAAPPTYNTSFSGSALPFPNPNMAYQNTPNKGTVNIRNGKFEFKLNYPNSYYSGLGSNLIEPCCHIKMCDSDEVHTIQLGSRIPFRMLTYPQNANRTSSMFYNNFNNTVRTQEQIIRDSGYPTENKIPDNFWGLRPRK